MKMLNKVTNSLFVLLILSACSVSTEQNKDLIVNGLFSGEIITKHKGVSVPVRLLFINNQAYFVNDTDTVKAESTIITNDSVVIKPMLYNTVINLKISNDSLIGNLIHLDINRKTPMFLTNTIHKVDNEPLKMSSNNFIFDHNWKATFLDGEKKKLSIAKFSKTQNYIAGNFRTETGDYRFLQGNIVDSTLWLSTFDGAHFYYFNATVLNDSLIKGSFYFGPEKMKLVELVKDDDFKLKDPNKITYMLNPSENFNFNALSLKGDSVSFSNIKSEAKVTIVQVMGSWCPNCMDETNFFTQLYTKYHQKGLNIIGVTFERSEELNKSKPFIDRMVKNLNIQYPIYFGGKPNTKNTKKVFSQLSGVKSYPTTIFLDENKQVIKIHTGFNGPATGKVYKDYEKEVIKLIENNL